MLDLTGLADLDADAACDALEQVHAELMAAEFRQFFLAAHWADLHSGEALEEQRRRTGRRALPGMERAKRLGADGTPLVAEFATMELGALLGMGFVAADCLVRDALNVRFRHPALWEALSSAQGRVWQARKVARMCASADLDRTQTRWVDAVTTPYLSSLPWGRFESLVEAKIIEADPEAAEQRRLAAAMARFVRTGQSNEFGLKTLVARANAGDVIFFVAMVDRIAQILAREGDGDPVDVRRSRAIGILATPERALSMLHRALAGRPGSPPGTGEAGDGEAGEGSTGEGSTGEAGTGWPEAGEAHGGDGVDDDPDVHPAFNDADDPAPDDPAPAGAGPQPRPGGCPGPVGGLSEDPRRLLLPAVLYVHLSEAALRHQPGGVARVEGVGPVTTAQVVDFLGHTNVRVVPVVDLSGQVPVDAYETPASLTEAMHLRNPVCVSPWGTNTSRRKDLDHVTPYLSPDDGGPPGQTGMGNLAPLSRFAHRVKTHGRWRLRQPRPGVYEWRSPHGYWFRVDHRGTHRLGKGR